MRFTSTRYCLIALCVVSLARVTALWGDPPDRVGRLNLLNGTVSFHPESVEEWAPATLNYPMTIGDHLWTDQDGQAEVHVGSTAIRLASNTEISFLNLNDQTIQIRLSTGSLNLRLRHLGATEEIEVDTPNASISLLRAGAYRIGVQQSGDTSVTVRAGEVETTAGSEVFPVRLRQTAEVTGLDSPSYQVTTASPLDDWDRWCQARDQKEDQVASSQYVPRDEMSGVEDLDSYGRWSNDADFGPVWTPTVVVVGWAPYHFGHWAWVEPWGWTWIDDAPWGFAPFHYGRWVYRTYGWGWVPGPRTGRTVYAPALVVFVGGGGWRSSQAPGDSVGWFPLGPHEPFVPPYRSDSARPRDAGVDHIPYANRSIPGAVTFVPNETFVRGQPVGGAAVRLPNDEIMRAPVRGAFAPIAPQKESFLGGYAPSYASVARPPAFAMSRPVMARLTPPPQAVPFAVRQQEMSSRPGRPLDSATLNSMRQGALPVRPPVSVVSPGYSRRGDGQQSFSQPGVGGPRQPSVEQRDGPPQPSREPQQPRRQIRRDPWQPQEPQGDVMTPRQYPRRPQQPWFDPREYPRQPQDPAGDVSAPRQYPRQPQQPDGEMGTPREYPRQPRDLPRQPQQPSRQFQQPDDQPQQPAAGQVRPPGPAARQPAGQQRPPQGGSRQRILDDQDSGQ